MRTRLSLSVAILLGMFVGLIPEARGQVFLTKDEALRAYFPEPLIIERKTAFLTDKQVESIQARAKSKVESKVVMYYVARGKEGVAGYAFLETHVIRTMPATYMIVVNPDTTIRAMELLAFYEPEDYLPPKRWLDQFRSKSFRNDLWLKRGIHNIVGATLSAQALTDGARRILATFEEALPKE